MSKESRNIVAHCFVIASEIRLDETKQSVPYQYSVSCKGLLQSFFFRNDALNWRIKSHLKPPLCLKSGLHLK